MSNSGGANVAVTGVVQGDIILSTSDGPFRIEEYPVTANAGEGRSWRAQPSHLLAAANQVVPFISREEELASLTEWRDELQQHVAVRLIHGPGGQGKTRLAARLAEISAQSGWIVEAVRHSSELSFSQPSRTHGENPCGRLLIVDYAERWPRADLIALFQSELVHPNLRTRVLLLARSAGQWWASLAHPLGKAGALADEMPLKPLADTTAARRTVFDSARDRFAELLSVRRPKDILPPSPLSDDAYRLVLNVHMAAFVAVDAHARGGRSPSEPGDLSAYLLDRELDHWATLHDTGLIATNPTVMSRVVFIATLAQGVLEPTRISDLFQRTGLADSPSAAQQLLDDHRKCYPYPTRTAPLEPLYPDRLAEDFIALQLPDYQSGRQADPWTAAVPGLLLSGTESRDIPSYAGAVTAFLVEVSRRWPHVSQTYLNPLLRRQPRLGLAAGGHALTVIAEDPAISIEVLSALSAILNSTRNAEFDPAFALISSRLTDYYLSGPTALGVAAIYLGPLAARLDRAGMYEKALPAAEEVVEQNRAMAALLPDHHGEPPLLGSLTNLAGHLHRVGRHADAREAIREAVDLGRRVAARDANHEDMLAHALINMSAVMVSTEPNQSMAAAEEATQILRRLVASSPDRWENDLAAALRTLATSKNRLGMREEAVSAAQESVQRWRATDSRHPGSHQPELARALAELGEYLVNAGKPAAGLPAMQEAIILFRQLMVANPKVYARDLTQALNSLSFTLLSENRYQESHAAAEESIEICRNSAASNQPEVSRRLCAALGALCMGLLVTDKPELALSAAEEHVEVSRELAHIDANSQPDLAQSLHNFSAIQISLGNRKAAQAAAQESVDIYHHLAVAAPQRYTERLAEEEQWLQKCIMDSGASD